MPATPGQCKKATGPQRPRQQTGRAKNLGCAGPTEAAGGGQGLDRDAVMGAGADGAALTTASMFALRTLYGSMWHHFAEGGSVRHQQRSCSAPAHLASRLLSALRCAEY